MQFLIQSDVSLQCNLPSIPGGDGVSLRERDLVPVDRPEHLRQLRALFAEQRPLAALLHLPPAHHRAERVRVHLKKYILMD